MDQGRYLSTMALTQYLLDLTIKYFNISLLWGDGDINRVSFVG